MGQTSKSLVTAIIVGSLVGTYMWYGPIFWEQVSTTYGFESSSFLYGFGAVLVVLFSFFLARILTYGMNKK